MSKSDHIAAIAEIAAAWQDLDYPPRVEAVRATLAAENAFTEEAIAFAINQQMALLTPSALTAWIQDRTSAQALTVGVRSQADVPMEGLRDLLAVVLTGHRYVGGLAAASPALLPAFAEDVRQRTSDLPAEFTDADALFERSDAVVATVTDENRAAVEAACEAHGILPDRRLLREVGYAVAVLDGRESAEERERLAEDVLLHEGYGPCRVALIWAPRGLDPDPYLEAFAHFRGVFPAHTTTPGRLKMQQAFLDATGTPNAYGDGLEFLMSKGAPDVQPPGHVRWSEYESLSDVAAWLDAHNPDVCHLAAGTSARRHLNATRPATRLGKAHRPGLDRQPGGHDTVAFLERLGSPVT